MARNEVDRAAGLEAQSQQPAPLASPSVEIDQDIVALDVPVQPMLPV